MFFLGKNRKTKIKQKLASNINEPFAVKDVFEDEALAALIASSLGIGSAKAKTTLDQLSRIKTIDAKGKGISSLSGIEFLNGLKIADFSDNNINTLPDYSEFHPYLYKNKDTLLYMNVENNPFLREDFLFNLDNSENRRLFFNQFKDYANRFNVGPKVQQKIFSNAVINPILIHYFIEKALPSIGLENKEKAVNQIFIEYLAGKKLLYEESPDYEFFFDDGILKFKDKSSYLQNEDLLLLDPFLESIIPENDLYLIKSLINHYDPNQNRNFTSFDEALNYYRTHLDQISNGFIKTEGQFEKKTSYRELKSSAISGLEEKRLNAVNNEQIKKLYLKYLEYENILNEYAKEHSSQDVYKYINKSNDFIDNFIDQYIELQDNPLLSDLQKARINEAEPALEKFVNNFTEEARSFFEQDIFGLEVDMKYIDMLSEANRKFN